MRIFSLFKRKKRDSERKLALYRREGGEWNDEMVAYFRDFLGTHTGAELLKRIEDMMIQYCLQPDYNQDTHKGMLMTLDYILAHAPSEAAQEAFLRRIEDESMETDFQEEISRVGG